VNNCEASYFIVDVQK